MLPARGTGAAGSRERGAARRSTSAVSTAARLRPTQPSDAGGAGRASTFIWRKGPDSPASGGRSAVIGGIIGAMVEAPGPVPPRTRRGRRADAARERHRLRQHVGTRRTATGRGGGGGGLGGAAGAGGAAAGTGCGAGAAALAAAAAAATICAELISSSSTEIGDEPLLVGDLVAAVELEVPLAPAQELLEQPVGLEAQGLEELRALDVAPLDQQVDQPAAGRLVLGGGPGEVRGADHPLLEQDLGEPLLQRLVEGVGGDDAAVEEGDGDDVLLALDRQDAGLLLLGDQLQDLRQLEEVEGTFNRHVRSPRRPARAAPPEPDSEVERQAQDRDDPGQKVARIIPPGDADSEPPDQRQHQQGGRQQQGEEGPPPLADLGRGDAGQQDAPPAVERPPPGTPPPTAPCSRRGAAPGAGRRRPGPGPGRGTARAPGAKISSRPERASRCPQVASQLAPDLRDAGDAAREGHHPLLLWLAIQSLTRARSMSWALRQGDLLLVEHVGLGVGLAQVVLRRRRSSGSAAAAFWKLWMALLKSPLRKE